MNLGVKDPTRVGGQGEDAQPAQAPRARSGAEPDPEPDPSRGGRGGSADVPRMFRGLPRRARRLWQTLTHPPAHSRAVI